MFVKSDFLFIPFWNIIVMREKGIAFAHARDSLKVLANSLSLSKHMKTLLFEQHTHLGVMFETQISI